MDTAIPSLHSFCFMDCVLNNRHFQNVLLIHVNTIVTFRMPLKYTYEISPVPTFHRTGGSAVNYIR